MCQRQPSAGPQPRSLIMSDSSRTYVFVSYALNHLFALFIAYECACRYLHQGKTGTKIYPELRDKLKWGAQGLCAKVAQDNAVINAKNIGKAS